MAGPESGLHVVFGPRRQNDATPSRPDAQANANIAGPQAPGATATSRLPRTRAGPAMADFIFRGPVLKSGARNFHIDRRGRK